LVVALEDELKELDDGLELLELEDEELELEEVRGGGEEELEDGVGVGVGVGIGVGVGVGGGDGLGGELECEPPEEPEEPLALESPAGKTTTLAEEPFGTVTTQKLAPPAPIA
jgi:hypothetical protein